MYPPTTDQYYHPTPPAPNVASSAPSVYSGPPPSFFGSLTTHGPLPPVASPIQYSSSPLPTPNHLPSIVNLGPPPTASLIQHPGFSIPASNRSPSIVSHGQPLAASTFQHSGSSLPASNHSPSTANYGPPPAASPTQHSGSSLPASNHSPSIANYGPPPAASPTQHSGSSLPALNHSSSIVNYGPPPAASPIQHSGSLPASNHSPSIVNYGPPPAASPIQNSRLSPITPSELSLPSTSYQQPNNENRDQYIETVRFLLQEMKKLNIGMENLQKKLDKADAEQDETFEPPTGFPIRELTEFDTFENDEERTTSLQRHLEFVGGQNLRDALNKFIRSSITNNVAENFTWTGKSNGSQTKRALYKTKLAKIFYRAAKKINRIGKFTRSEFISHLQEILRSYKQTARNARLSLNNQRQRNRRMEDEEELFPDDDDEDDENINTTSRRN